MDLTVVVRVRAPPALVFRALTTPDGLNEFWTKRASIAPRVDGRFRFWLDDPASEEPDVAGTVIGIEPDASIGLAFDQPDGSPDPHPITISIEPDARGGCEVELLQADLDEDDEEALEEKFDEWEDLLSRLKATAERWHAKAREAREEREAREKRGR